VNRILRTVLSRNSNTGFASVIAIELDRAGDKVCVSTKMQNGGIMKLHTRLPAILLMATLNAVAPMATFAQDAKAAPQVREVLMSNVGKRVALRLSGDQDIEGTVTSVGADTVVVAKLTGKDFYDAVIVISKISAVTYKAR
jgi:hypothetical protein